MLCTVASVTHGNIWWYMMMKPIFWLNCMTLGIFCRLRNWIYLFQNSGKLTALGLTFVKGSRCKNQFCLNFFQDQALYALLSAWLRTFCKGGGEVTKGQICWIPFSVWTSWAALVCLKLGPKKALCRCPKHRGWRIKATMTMSEKKLFLTDIYPTNLCWAI